MEVEKSVNDYCKPIRNIEEFYNFMKNPPNWNQLVIPLSKRGKAVKNSDLYKDGYVCHLGKIDATVPNRFEYGSLPRTLVCHDMMNGYHDDSSVHGTGNHEAYSFYHWAAIDMFIYFSHHFITIPPLSWINVAHKHGVPILGTLITEWTDGIEICAKILKSEKTMKDFVHQLVIITRYFHIDGWLLNIENDVGDVDMLLKFVQYLTSKMHSENPNSVIIWYDSVINTGALRWQNCLNSVNKDFFNACDGIFTNYCWNLDDLEGSVVEAGGRKHDVYVGVDVWGRNFWGGGCFNTVEAVKEIHKFGLSIAIFAPAWTHETILTDSLLNQQNDTKNDKCAAGSEKSHIMKCAIRERFILRETALWNSLWPYLNSRGPSQLPFQTFFCLGSGEKKRIDGEITNDNLWFNLREQEYQLSIPLCSNSYIMDVVEVPLKAKISPSSVIDSDNQNRGKREDIKNISEACCPQNNSTCTKCDSVEEARICTEEVVNKIKVSSTEASPKRRKPPIKIFYVKPNLEHISCVSLYNNDSFYGGSCIKISPIDSTSKSDNKIITRLLICEFLCDYNFVVFYVVKNINEDLKQDLNLLVTLRQNVTNENITVILSDKLHARDIDTSGEAILNPENDKDVFKRLQINLLNEHSGFYVPINNEQDWKIRYFSLAFPNSTMMEINCELTEQTGSILLGGLGVVKDVVSF